MHSRLLTKALAGGSSTGLPVLSIAAPFNRNAAIPHDDVTVRDVAGYTSSTTR